MSNLPTRPGPGKREAVGRPPRRRVMIVLATVAIAGATGVGYGPTAGATERLSFRDRTIYRAAFAAAATEDWTTAATLAGGAVNRLPAKAIRWLALMRDPAAEARFGPTAAFIDANPDWPGLDTLRRRAEQALALDPQPDPVVRRWFDRHPPVTAIGRIAFADALAAAGGAERDGLPARARAWWVADGFDATDEERFLARFGRWLGPADHQARLDRLLWDGHFESATRMLGRVGDGWRRLAVARMRLAQRRPGVDDAVAAVPAGLRRHPGLVYERLRWRRRAGLEAGAIELLQRAPAELGRPDPWWTERHILVRRLFDRRADRAAFALADGHRQTPDVGFPHTQASFVAGWLALRFVGDPAAALRHFDRLYRTVDMPISLARGAYWAGRALEAMGKQSEARARFRAAARHTTTFYGILAAARLGDAAPLTFGADPPIAATARALFGQREVIRLVRLLFEIDPDRTTGLVDLFLRRLRGRLDGAVEYALATELARAVDRADQSVWIAKAGVRDGVILFEGGYPLIRLGRNPAVPQSLVHAVIRQESSFNPEAISRAGARGLMQLMPRTASAVARRLGVDDHRRDRLTEDPGYNIRLGRRYLGEMVARFGGALVPAVAAYNAGPARVERWIAARGDPRGRPVDAVVDWIEGLPIYETRNYVQRVLEARQVYRARLGDTVRAADLVADLVAELVKDLTR